MVEYKCSKCGDILVDKSGHWGGMYMLDGREIIVQTMPCYCYHCHRYTAAQIGIKRHHLQNKKNELISRLSWFDRLFNTAAYKKVKYAVKVCKLLECILDRVKETYTSCVECGSNAVLLIDDLDGVPHSEKCDGHLVRLPKKDTNIRFRWSPRTIYPVVRPKYEFPKSAGVEYLEKNVIDYYWIRL